MKYLILALAFATLFLTGCDATRVGQAGNSPVADSGDANRYAFATERDPQRGDVIRIFDQQTGDYWIKWVGTDQGSGKVYSIWNHFPLNGEPKSGLTEISTLEVDGTASLDTTSGKTEEKPAQKSKTPSVKQGSAE